IRATSSSTATSPTAFRARTSTCLASSSTPSSISRSSMSSWQATRRAAVSRPHCPMALSASSTTGCDPSRTCISLMKRRLTPCPRASASTVWASLMLSRVCAPSPSSPSSTRPGGRAASSASTAGCCNCTAACSRTSTSRWMDQSRSRASSSSSRALT
ncbi:hypothetical protein GGH95_003407, partial [Coemansia sp. RSA 1836]